MSKIIRQSLGVDISKRSLTVCLSFLYEDLDISWTKTEDFSNSKEGFNQLLKWVKKNSIKELPVTYVMEATGNYHEPLAYHLHKIHKPVMVVLANKIKNYQKSLNVKSKTDPVDAKVIARYGVERKDTLWTPPAEIYLALRQLTRFHEQLLQQRTMFKNMLRSKESGVVMDELVLKLNRQMISRLDKQIQSVQERIETIISQDKALNKKVENICTIKGIGIMTATIIIAETAGFELFNSQRQLASYAGFDVVEWTSGTSVKRKTRISKKGNSHIRRALYFPSIIAARYSPHFKTIYNRITESKPSKMIAVVAIQRKLLLLIYTLWKKDEAYKESKYASGNEETKPLLRHKRESLLNEVGRS